MSDSSRLRGTALSRTRMATIGAAMVASAVVLTLIALTALSGALAALGLAASAVLAFAGLGRLLWAARRRRLDLLPWLCFGWLRRPRRSAPSWHPGSRYLRAVTPPWR